MLDRMTHPDASRPLNVRTSTALITGASSGIGESLARRLAAHGADLILVARNEARLSALAAELRGRCHVQVHVLPADLNRPGAAADLHAAVQARGLNVDILVNNAGLGSYGEFRTQPPAEIDRMIAVNVSALTALTRAFLPDMLARGRGRVLNVASTAAFQPGPMMAVYYATKAYVLSFSEAVAEEVTGSGVSVTALCPGPVQTGFQAVSQLHESDLLSGPARLTILSADEVARLGVQGMLRGQRVVVAGRLNRVQTLLPRLLPRAVMTRLIARVQARRH
ncbi:SDR family oxidoreductase [Deinococcus depolymerans]|uniref:SDR family oxidoreductase n=2 Tax=Deinococcus depolymerans TaxID=392408 RepID=A0ABP3LGM8_9DEIO